MLIRYPLIIWLGIWLHATWAGLLVWSWGPLHTVALSGLCALAWWPVAAGLLALASGCAVASLRVAQWRVHALLLVPQQGLLLWSAGEAMQAVLASQYADGVLRPWPFIAADQAYVVALALFHTYVLWRHLRYGLYLVR